MATLGQVLWSQFGLRGLADKINAGVDLHSEVAALLLGKSYEETVALVAASDPDAKKARQFAKIANFGFPGGMSADTLVHFALQQDEKIAPQFAAELKRIWQQANPEIATYLRSIRRYQNARTKRYDFQIPGTGLTRVGATYCSTANGHFQGLGAALMKRIAGRVVKESFTVRSSPLWGTRALNFIHDEVLQEIPIGPTLTPAARRIEEIFEETFPAFCPDVRMKTEAVAMFYWSKDAKRYVIDGELQPWPMLPDLEGQTGARADRIRKYWETHRAN